MKKFNDIFCELPCLTEQFKQFSGIELQKTFFKNADKRLIGQVLQKFVNYNAKSFEFLGVTPSIVGIDQDVSLCFRTSAFVGTIPLRAPDTGKQIGDFVVVPRFIARDRYADYVEILNLLDNQIEAQFIESLPLKSGYHFRPPLYLEAVKFIDCLTELTKTHWQKFSRVEKTAQAPVGQVNWNKYIANQFKVENQQRYPVATNVMTEFHAEYAQLAYVFSLCKNEINSPRTPVSLKLRIKKKLDVLEEKLYFHRPLKTDHLIEKQSDLPVVKRCKEQANRVLNFQGNLGTAWRVDFSDVFEKFVQHIFTMVAKQIGGNFFANYKIIRDSKRHYAWELHHLEPDGIFKKDSSLLTIDAKYKSHLLNRTSSSEQLKTDYRHDLHQILGYASFDTHAEKKAILCYPSNELEVTETVYLNRINQSKIRVKILGIPLRADTMSEVKRFVIENIFDLGSNQLKSIL
ncbi:hypothetical protein RGU72_15495 [Undibacterium sp. 5I1]|uniref:hypothetical protein n=2 Tax=Pseudomonadota TaxID=1224 RepID=UPI002AB3EE06|nr:MULTISPECIES: hypothetical protein [unclassified Undibacterium]MDY7539657.1 hypothetical protein [Undibacterium sp. 5I1]MEB0232236.1 hypothetical protein [Undibacterium sp. 10I3]MEB0257433.1 hypothetical protein [Undibacterium sp. 5I1]